jgi:hypothetical protein
VVAIPGLVENNRKTGGCIQHPAFFLLVCVPTRENDEGEPTLVMELRGGSWRCEGGRERPGLGGLLVMEMRGGSCPAPGT